ncbi:hypothetical protein FKW77_003907 [Venturia effusa]|uniref:C2H2-type domain-containing protein n=1 Tax=Venturia effusa TaxID=50376 RepID=A0A517LAS6_9PEZI|nr:hypothetical protein FKW77_003907 [Venturia effusa]
MVISSNLQVMDPVLAEAIKDAPKARLRRLLLEILEKHPDAITTATEHLVAAVPDVTNKNGKRVVTDNSNELPVKRRKRYDRCVQCKEEFDVKGTHMEACNWHKGELEMDDENDMWLHWTEGHGIADSEESKKAFPEGFIWDCCQRHGDAEFGCKRGPHRNEKERFEYVQRRGDDTDEDVDEEGYVEDGLGEDSEQV